MAVQRINIANNKRSTLSKQKRREIGNLLKENKFDKARIKVEHVLREDYTVEGLEILELYLELVHERVRQITTSKDCPETLMEAVQSIIWASNNVQIDELKEVKNQFAKKYGKEFVKVAEGTVGNSVNNKLMTKILCNLSEEDLQIQIDKYMEEIAATYGADWKAPIREPQKTNQNNDNNNNNSGGNILNEPEFMPQPIHHNMHEQSLFSANTPIVYAQVVENTQQPSTTNGKEEVVNNHSQEYFLDLPSAPIPANNPTTTENNSNQANDSEDVSLMSLRERLEALNKR